MTGTQSTSSITPLVKTFPTLTPIVTEATKITKVTTETTTTGNFTFSDVNTVLI